VKALMQVPIGQALQTIADMTVEEALALVEDIHPDDRALSEKEVGQKEGGWQKYADLYPKIFTFATYDEHYGLMTTALRRTIIGHSLVCRSHGIVLHTRVLM